MENKSTKPLMDLSIETKQLVNRGVFSLYTLADRLASGATFVLYTEAHSFLLADSGEIVQQLDGKTSFKVKNSVTFPEIVTKAITFGKYNIA